MSGTTDTIFALATPPGRGGIAVFRISGPRAGAALEAATGRARPAPRRLSVRHLLDAGGAAVDEAMVVWFPEGRSYTGEEMAELHVHGGRATAARVSDMLSSLDGCRIADPGEFTRRALENGRMDLLQVEGLADLIDAETEMQRAQALALVKGEASGRVARWRRDLLSALALLEASIDFADEEEAPLDVTAEVDALISGVLTDLDEELRHARFGERVREGFRVALVGAPNSGKSTLFNRLVGREAAITSDVPGTTRDVIEAACDFRGLPVILQDLAGLRASEDRVERIGVDRAFRAAELADLRLFLCCEEQDAGVYEHLRRPGDIAVWTKSDLADGPGDISISAVRGVNIAALSEAIATALSSRAAGSGVMGRRRQIIKAQAAAEYLRRGLNERMVEIKVLEIRQGLSELESLIGAIGVEDVLDEIFSRFCMGK